MGWSKLDDFPWGVGESYKSKSRGSCFPKMKIPLNPPHVMGRLRGILLIQVRGRFCGHKQLVIVEAIIQKEKRSIEMLPV